MLGAVPDFRPTKPSGEYYGMPELTQEQRNLVASKSSAYVKDLQKNLVKFITDNGGKVTYQDMFLNSLTAEVPSKLVKKLAERSDVISIERGDKKYSTTDYTQKKPYKNESKRQSEHTVASSICANLIS